MKLNKIIECQKDFFNQGYTKEYEFRIKSLNKLLESLKFYQDELITAMKLDMNKSDFETCITEIFPVKKEIINTIKKLKKYMKNKKVKTSIINFLATSYIRSEPYGIVAIISPWNYPINLTLLPLVGAIAAGNCVILKLDERLVNLSIIIKKIIERAFENKYIYFLEGDGKVSAELTKMDIDYIFFTGSNKVGKLVLEASAKNLVPVTLELGGKSPTILNDSKDLKVAARKIVYGKFLNNGQTCIATDYLLLNKKYKKEFISNLKRETENLYPSLTYFEDSSKLFLSNRYNKLKEMINNSKVLFGGKCDDEKKLILPTIIETSLDDNIMKEEIFAPILPIIYYNNIDEAIKIVNKIPNPLVIYLFTSSKEIVSKVEKNTTSGTLMVNDTIMQIIEENLPFGGVGDSGFGRYHGIESFNTFSNKKTIIKKYIRNDFVLKYRKYNNLISKYIKKI